MEKILIATKNSGKFGEIKVILEDLPFEFIYLCEVRVKDDDFEEIYETHEENAMLKAHYYSAKTGFLTLADDSGIQVDALQGQLGVKTRRWGAGPNASDIEWIEHFLKVMKDVPEAEKTARFLCYVAVSDPLKRIEDKVFEGAIEGLITHELEAPIIPGLPLSSCFRPKGFDKVFAALTKYDKGVISHRGLASQKAGKYLKNNLKLLKDE